MFLPGVRKYSIIKMVILTERTAFSGGQDIWQIKHLFTGYILTKIRNSSFRKHLDVAGLYITAYLLCRKNDTKQVKSIFPKQRRIHTATGC